MTALADHPEGAQQVPVEAVVEQAVGHGRRYKQVNTSNNK
jgi:hypothetical protein